MSISKASITSNLAGKAREQLEEFNKDVIAKAKAEGKLGSVGLKTDGTLEGYKEALDKFRTVCCTGAI